MPSHQFDPTVSVTDSRPVGELVTLTDRATAFY